MTRPRPEPGPPADWARIEDLFHQVVENPRERDRLLADADPEIAREVASLLDAEARGSELVDGAVAASLEWLAPSPIEPSGTLSGSAGTPRGDALRQIGPYRLLRELGRGGFGTVYLAERRDGDFRIEVALKRVRGAFWLDGLDERLRLERRILARLEHPNIARLFDGGTDDEGQPYFVMERVEGEPIDLFCDRRRWTLRQRLELMLPVCDAVAFAHRNLVIHRDLKPSNILVTEEGVPKLLDFGIAKLLDDDPVGGLTQGGRAPFTPEYASPEQVAGRDLTTATDVYSLGVLLYRLLTGRPPVPVPSDASPADLERLLHETPARPLARPYPVAPPDALGEESETGGATVAARRQTTPTGLRRRLRGDLENIVGMALRREPERRYGSARELADDLRRHLDDQPVLATGDSLGYRLGRFVRRHRWAVAAVVLLASSLIGGIVSTTFQMRQAQRHQARAEQVMELLTYDVFGSIAPERARGDQPTLRETLDRSVDDLDRRLADTPDVHGTVLMAVGRLYQGLGVYDRSSILIQRGRELLRSFHGEHHPEVLAATSDLADVLFDLGRQRAARDLLESVLEPQRRRGSRGAGDLATSLLRLARVERTAGDLEAAQLHLDASLTLRRHSVEESPLAVAEGRALAARLAHERGDREGAELEARAALDLRRHHLGADHPLTLVSLNDLAVILQERDALESAEGLFREVVEINRRVHGSDHRNLANALANLGWVVGRRGRLDEAIALLDQALDIHRDVLGPGHTTVAADRRNLARLHRRRGDFEAASTLLGENLLQARERSGVASLPAARALLDLAALDFDRGDLATAARRYDEAARRLELLLPESDWRRFLPHFEAGRALRELGRLTEAEPRLRRANDGYGRVLGDDAVRTLRARAELGLCLWQAGRVDEATPLLEPSLAALRSQLDPEDEQLRWIVDRVAD